MNKSDIRKKMEVIGKKMMEYANYATPSYLEDDKEEKRNKYYEFKKEYSELRNELNKILDEESNKKNDENKIFINSYGEATTREITSSIYKRQQKKQAKELMKWLS